MTVERYLARPSLEIRGERPAKERLRGRNAAVCRLINRALDKLSRISNTSPYSEVLE
jgi:hypothetical protein